MSSALSWCAGPAALAGFVPTIAPPSRPLAPAASSLMLARRALASESYEEALRCFDVALRHEPRLALAHLGRTVCLAQIGREREAAEALGVVMDSARGQEEVLYHLAQMCAREGESTIGAALLREAVLAMPALDERAAEDRFFADHPAYLMAIGRL